MLKQEGDESLGGKGGIQYFSKELVVCIGGNKIIYKHIVVADPVKFHRQ